MPRNFRQIMGAWWNNLPGVNRWPTIRARGLVSLASFQANSISFRHSSGDWGRGFFTVWSSVLSQLKPARGRRTMPCRWNASAHYAIRGIVARQLKPPRLPLLPSGHMIYLMAKAAVAVYEAAEENDRRRED
jgi:hypothetical protein